MKISTKLFYAKNNSAYVKAACRYLLVKNYMLHTLTLQENCETFCSTIIKHNKILSKSLKPIVSLKILRPFPHTLLSIFIKKLSKKLVRLRNISVRIAPESPKVAKTGYIFSLILESLLRSHRSKNIEVMTFAYTNNQIVPKFENIIRKAISSQTKLRQYKFDMVSLLIPYHSNSKMVTRCFNSLARLNNLETLSFETSWLRNKKTVNNIGSYFIKILQKLQNLDLNGVISDDDNQNSKIVQGLAPYFQHTQALRCLSLHFFNYIPDEKYDSTLESIQQIFGYLTFLTELRIKVHFYANISPLRSFLAALAGLKNLKILAFSILQKLMVSGMLLTLAESIINFSCLEQLSLCYFGDPSKNSTEDKELSTLGLAISSLKNLQFLKLWFSAYSNMNYETMFSSMERLESLKYFKFNGNFKTTSMSKKLFEYISSLEGLESVKLSINPNEKISKACFNGLSSFISKCPHLKKLSITTGDCSSKEIYLSNILNSMNHLTKLNLKGLYVTSEEWINLIDSIPNFNNLNKLIIMGAFDRDFDISSMELLAGHTKRTYMRFTVLRDGKMPYTMEINQLTEGVI